jgi:uncharacterized Ntn-hydrolase superfamily protein
MTWSIVARDPATGSFGVAVATRAFAVGARCPWLRAGVGAVSTQSMSNHFLGPLILDRLQAGLEPAQAIESALAGDSGRGLRQVHCVDRHGRSAAWTGDNCVEWCGHQTGREFSVAGNMLSGARVVAASYEAFAEGEGAVPRASARALHGEAAGGDKRGKQSAAMMVMSNDIIADVLRVDDLTRCAKSRGCSRSGAATSSRAATSFANPSGVTDLDLMEADGASAG